MGKVEGGGWVWVWGVWIGLEVEECFLKYLKPPFLIDYVEPSPQKRLLFYVIPNGISYRILQELISVVKVSRCFEFFSLEF